MRKEKKGSSRTCGLSVKFFLAGEEQFLLGFRKDHPRLLDVLADLFGQPGNGWEFLLPS